MMILVRWIALAAMTLLSWAAAAQDDRRTQDPADPAARVPALRYDSAFAAYRAARDADAAPGKVWRAANEEVQGHGSPSVSNPATEAPPPPTAPAGQDTHQHGKKK